MHVIFALRRTVLARSLTASLFGQEYFGYACSVEMDVSQSFWFVYVFELASVRMLGRKFVDRCLMYFARDIDIVGLVHSTDRDQLTAL